MRRARDGNLRAYEELVRSHLPIAHRTAVLLAGAADAEDVVQEALVKAYRALGRFRDTASFRPWLLQIVANEARNSGRAARRRAGLWARAAAATPEISVPAVEHDAVRGEQRRELLAAVEQLAERYRLVVTCRYLLELSEAETAQLLGLSPGTVKSRLSRALQRLRRDPDLLGGHGAEVGRDV